MHASPDFVSGMLVMGYLAVGVFFVRFQRQSRDRLFGIFAAAFFLLGVQRAAVVLLPELGNATYVLRALAFTMIIVGIIDKNRRA